MTFGVLTLGMFDRGGAQDDSDVAGKQEKL